MFQPARHGNERHYRVAACKEGDAHVTDTSRSSFRSWPFIILSLVLGDSPWRRRRSLRPIRQPTAGVHPDATDQANSLQAWSPIQGHNELIRTPIPEHIRTCTIEKRALCTGSRCGADGRVR
jgi:hypothetical protein